MKIFKAIALVVVVLVIGAVAYGTILIRRGFSATAEPSALEKVVARSVRNMAIPVRARNEQNPWKALDTADNEKEARHHFADHCATCHANDGSGQEEMGQGLYPKPPDMRLPATQNLTDGELYYIIENGVRLTGMPAWGDPHPSGDARDDRDEDSWLLVNFIRHLPHLTTDELKDMEHYNPTGPFDAEEEQAEEKQKQQESSGTGGAAGEPVSHHHHH